MQVTKDFFLSEFIESDTATRLNISNEPSETIKNTLINVLIPKMQEIRNLLGRPINISSGFRCPQLNAAVGGSSSSQHLTGNACDFKVPNFGIPKNVCILLESKKDTLQYDQLIYEGTWIHISFVVSNPRLQTLTADFSTKPVRYVSGIQ